MKVIYHHSVGPWMERRLLGLADSDDLEVEVVAPNDKELSDEMLSTVEVIWHVLEPLTADHISAAPRLRLIQKIGVGVNTIDVEAASARGVVVCNMPGTNSQAVAELALSMMFACLRRMVWLHGRTVDGHWHVPPEAPESMMELSGRTVGLVGYGSIPRILAPALVALGAKVIYTATSAKDDAVGEFREIDLLLEESDIVSLHVPLTSSTLGLIDRRSLQSMKPGSILVNTARGALVDQAALVGVLRSGGLAAAGLDVFGDEPVDPEDPILALDNVIVSPHIAWQTRETLERSLEVGVENCRRLRDGSPLLNQVTSP